MYSRPPRTRGGLPDRGVLSMDRSRLLLLLGLLLVLPSVVRADWPFWANGPIRGTPEYYDLHAADPIGQRQVCFAGKLWPATARPTGEPATCVAKFHANSYWPYPYSCADKAVVGQILNTQIANGWQQESTFFNYHFDPVTNELNSSGRDHLYWLLSSAPAEFRTAFVETSRVDPGISNARLASVQSEATRMVGVDQAPPIMLRVATPYGTPAQQVDAVFKYRTENLNPPPMVQYTSGASGASSSQN